MNACDICSKKCFGIDNYDGSCCTIENRDWIMGPINDSEQFLQDLSKKLNRNISKEEVFIEFEEGKHLFPNKSVWQNPENFPAFKVNLEDKRKPCIFYNTTVKSCMVYEIRPKTCRDFECSYLEENK